MGMRQQVDADPFHLVQQAISADVACTVEPGVPWQVVVRAADKALFNAKKTGRNRVKIATSEVLASEMRLEESLALGTQSGQPTQRGDMR